MSMMDNLKDSLKVDGVNQFITMEQDMDEESDYILEAAIQNTDPIFGDADDSIHSNTEDPDLGEDIDNPDEILDAEDMALLADENDPNHENSEDPDLDEDKDNTSITFVNESNTENLDTEIQKAIESLMLNEDSEDDDEPDDDEDVEDEEIGAAMSELADIMDSDDEDDMDDD